MHYKIVRTGSRGNCLYLQLNGLNAVIDLGVPYRDIRDLDINAVLLTHKHSDHFNAATVNRLTIEHPLTWWIVPQHMLQLFAGLAGSKVWQWDRIIPVSPHQIIRMGGAAIRVLPLHHDVPNVGYAITDADNVSVMYATDTNDIDHVSCPGYDYYFIEANYDEDEIEDVIEEKLAAGEFCHELRARDTHLSRQQADRWLADNAGPDSRFIYMHEHSDAHGGKG